MRCNGGADLSAIQKGGWNAEEHFLFWEDSMIFRRNYFLFISFITLHKVSGAVSGKLLKSIPLSW